MTLLPLQSVEGFPFGASRTALHSNADPIKERTNRAGLLEVDFGHIIYRFDQDHFVEATFQLPEVIEIDGSQIRGESLIEHLRQHDPRFREKHGFAIAPGFGLAVDLDEDTSRPWTTAFAEGKWD